MVRDHEVGPCPFHAQQGLYHYGLLIEPTSLGRRLVEGKVPLDWGQANAWQITPGPRTPIPSHGTNVILSDDIHARKNIVLL